MTSPLIGKALAAAVEPHERRVRDRNTPGARRYKLDPFAHLEDGHVWIPDLESLEMVRLDPWEHQADVLRQWIDLDHLARTGRKRPEDARLRFRNVHEEKSRQMGITWILAYGVWWIVSYHRANGLVLHLDSAKVDDGGKASTVDSFFGKVRSIHEARDEDQRLYLPPQYRAPLDWRMSPENQIKNLASDAFVTGEGATADPGRGGRYAWGILDEAARIPWGESVHASLVRAIPDGRLYNSTPEGDDNMYARLRKDRPRGYRMLRHHWTIHPVYSDGLHVAGEEPESCALCEGTVAGIPWNAARPASHRFEGRPTSPWYEEAIVDMTDEQVASELDIDYSRSLTARVYPEFDETTHVVEEGIPYDPSLPVELCFDYGLDMTSVGILQDAPYELRVIAEFEQSDLVPEQVAAGVRGVLTALFYEAVADGLMPPDQAQKLVEPYWTRQMFAIGDPAGEGRTLATARPLTADYATEGFVIQSKRDSIPRTINSVKRLLRNRPKPIRVCGQKCPETISHFKNNRWPTDRQGNRTPGAPEPKNDRHNHMMRALAYYACWKFPPPETVTPGRQGERHARGRDDGITYDMKL